METRAVKRLKTSIQDLHASVTELCTGIGKVSNTLGNIRASQQAESQKVAQFIKAESDKNAKKLQAMEGRLTEIEGRALSTNKEIEQGNIREGLLEKIISSDLPKFNGTGNPLAHIRAFRSQMTIKRIKKEHWPTLFPLSLENDPRKWFYSMEPKRVSTFDRIILEFGIRYHNNTQASKRTFGSLSQGDNESFSEYFCRWTDFIIQSPNQPQESEFITRFINNLRPDYRARMKNNKIENLHQLVTIGTKVENDLKKPTHQI